MQHRLGQELGYYQSTVPLAGGAGGEKGFGNGEVDFVPAKAITETVPGLTYSATKNKLSNRSYSIYVEQRPLLRHHDMTRLPSISGVTWL